MSGSGLNPERTLADRAYRRFLRDIVTGRLSAGTTLHLRRTAEEVRRALDGATAADKGGEP